MKETGRFLNHNLSKDFYQKIIPVYQKAFSGEPWYEVSKCVSDSKNRKCAGGISSLSIGTKCETCGRCTNKPAYEAIDLIPKFERIKNDYPSAWYLEGEDDSPTLVVFAWKANAELIASEKYADVPEMESWMNEKLGNSPLIWLDEVFADRNKKPNGNLSNFGKMSINFANLLQAEKIAYRTITDQMLIAPKNAFKSDVSIFNKSKDVPDRRDFVLIDLGGVTK